MLYYNKPASQKPALQGEPKEQGSKPSPQWDIYLHLLGCLKWKTRNQMLARLACSYNGDRCINWYRGHFGQLFNLSIVRSKLVKLSMCMLWPSQTLPQNRRNEKGKKQLSQEQAALRSSWLPELVHQFIGSKGLCSLSISSPTHTTPLNEIWALEAQWIEMCVSLFEDSTPPPFFFNECECFAYIRVGGPGYVLYML